MDDATPSLFAASTARFSAPHNNTVTSKAAARAIDATGKGASCRQRILALANAPLCRERGITQEDICELLGIQTSTCNPRVNELTWRDKYLEITGTRKISTGRMAQVYAITPAGVEAIGATK